MGEQVYPWLIHVDVWQKPPKYCKKKYSPIKINQLILKINIIYSNIRVVGKDGRVEGHGSSSPVRTP